MFLNNLKWAGVAALVCGLALHRRRRDGPAGWQGTGSECRRAVPKDHANTATTVARDLRKIAAQQLRRAGRSLAKIEDLRKEHIKAAAREWDMAYEEFLRKPNRDLSRLFRLRSG